MAANQKQNLNPFASQWRNKGGKAWEIASVEVKKSKY